MSGRKDSVSDTPIIGSIIIIIVVVLVTTTTLNYSAQANAASASSASRVTSNWSQAPNYPIGVWLTSCATSGGYIYCVGGLEGSTLSGAVSGAYYAKLSPSGIAGQWVSTTSYPVPIRAESCVITAGTIYCVAGYSASVSVDTVYFASVSSSGIGTWTKTTNYPMTVGTLSCATSGAGIYCVGGTTSFGNPTNATYFAPFMPSGLGAWTQTTSYPIPIRQQSCVATTADLYCIGGFQSSKVYFAPITSSGLGQWTSSTGYPTTGAANLVSCALASSTVYCVGGTVGAGYSDAVFQASLSPSGAGSWSADAAYPVSLRGASCAASAGSVYCVGGEDASGAAIAQVSVLVAH